MKRSFLTLIFVLWASCSWAFPPGFVEILGSGITTADYCADKLGSYSLYYDLDHPLGLNTACISGGTATATWTSTYPTVSTEANMTSGGTYGILQPTVGGADKYVELPATGISTTNGRVEFDLSFPSTIPTSTDMAIFEWWDGVNSNIQVKAGYAATNQIRLIGYHRDGTTMTSITGYITVTGLTAYHCVFDWNSTTGYADLSFGAATPGHVSGTISEFTTPSSGVRFGEFASGGGNIYGLRVDNIKMGVSQQ